MSAGVMLVVAMASVTSFLMSIENIPGQVASSLLGITDSPFLLLLLLNLILLLLGIVFWNLLLRSSWQCRSLNQVFPMLDIHPVQFGVMVVLNLMIGMVTPPVGLCLFIVSTIGRVSLERISRVAMPMICICLIVLMLVAYVPWLTLALPGVAHGGSGQ
jgi:C4-dicarboxylate transporter DctM subunit